VEIRIVLPEPAIRRRIQNVEGAFYWSACIESVLRRQRIVSISTVDSTDNQALGLTRTVQIFARGTVLHDVPRGTVLEGPRQLAELEQLGLAAEERCASSLDLFDAGGKCLGPVAYQACLVRPIPPSNGETSEPYLNVAQDPKWNNRTVRYQVFTNAPRWLPLLWADRDGERQLIAVKKDGVVVLGIALGDILAAGYAFPPLDAGYYQMLATPPGTEVEERFCRIVMDLAAESGVPISLVAPWPEGKRIALTVRHDCDRPLKLKNLLGLLLFYRRWRVRASFGVLQGNLPRVQRRLITLCGHEINLHSVSCDAQQLVEERRTLEALSRSPVLGFHSHGGAGSAGFLGDRHYEWAQSAGFRYVEMVGRSTRQPHAINRVIGGLPVMTDLIAPGVHFSLDAGMADDQHLSEYILSSLDWARRMNAHVVIMNHPDIHLSELRSLLLRILDSDVWTATLADVVQWYRATRLTRDAKTGIDEPAMLNAGSAHPVGGSA
jgi:hypothetical protein